MDKPFVEIIYNGSAHRIEATDAKELGRMLVVYKNEKVVGRFELIKVEYWSLETAVESVE